MERQRLEAQHRRRQGLEAALPQRRERGVIVRMRSRDKDGHGSGLLGSPWNMDLADRLHFKTSQCYPGGTLL